MLHMWKWIHFNILRYDFPCREGIYSRGWYLAKRNIAVCQIKATTMAAAATQQQMHLKGCIRHCPSRIFTPRYISCQPSIHGLHRIMGYPATIIRDLKTDRRLTNDVLRNCIEKKKKRKIVDEIERESDNEQRTLQTGMQDCETGR